MREDLRRRRRLTFQLLYCSGCGYSQTVAKIADEFDVTESAVEDDIAKMNKWLPKLDGVGMGSAVARVLKVRQQHQKLSEMAAEARDRGDGTEEVRRLRKTIADLVETEHRMSERVGFVRDEPSDVELSDRLDPDNEDLVEEFCMVEADDDTVVSLEEME